MTGSGNIAPTIEPASSFQDVILRLQTFWAGQGCVLGQPYDTEMGAGTSHPWTALFVLGPDPWRTAFVQPSRRPGDGRYGDNPNRLQRYFQFQALLKPAPENPQQLLLQSYQALGIDLSKNDIRFVQDDWENPSLGAAGLGWEVWLNGMEVTQFTYFQQMGGIACAPVAVELTYGLERIAMALQQKDSCFDLVWANALPSSTQSPSALSTYGHLTLRAEREFCHWHFQLAPIELLTQQFEEALSWGHQLVDQGLVLPAYDLCLKASHSFNVLDARGAIGQSQRPEAIGRIRHLAGACCRQWLASGGLAGGRLGQE
jgi:glycyl-tRNA synthetase alpha chain